MRGCDTLEVHVQDLNRHIYRRSFLQTAAAGAVGISGCSMVPGRSGPHSPQLIALTALNFDRTSHTFHVRLALDDTPVYESAERIKAAAPDDPRGAVFQGYPEPERPKPYVLSAWIDDRESTVRQLAFTSVAANCLGVELQYGGYNEPVDRATLAIATTTNCNETGQ
jgi:hypothetical protein